MPSILKDFRKKLSRLPGWLFSGITLLIILWLTLAPKPFGEESPSLFPGADKLAHALMFGYFTAMMLCDWQRKHRWKKLNLKFTLTVGLISSIIGIVIEIAQLEMGLGRGFEYADIIADTVGSAIVAVAWVPAQNYWVADSDSDN